MNEITVLIILLSFIIFLIIYFDTNYCTIKKIYRQKCYNNSKYLDIDYSDNIKNSKWKTVYITPLDILSLNFKDSCKNIKRTIDYKITLKVPITWEQYSNSFSDLTRRLEGFDGLYQVSDDFVLDANINKQHNGGGLIHVQDCCIVEGISKLGYHYILYNPNFDDDNFNDIHWVFIRLSSEFIAVFSVFLEFENKDDIFTIIDSIQFEKIYPNK